MSSATYTKVKIENISYVVNMGYIVFLRRDNEDENVLPICIGPAEAQAIAAAYNDLEFPRPMTHDLFRNVLNTLDFKISRIQVTDLRDGTFFARLFLRQGIGEEIEVDARPSDAIAMALRYSAPIYVNEEVFDSAGVNIRHVHQASKAQTADARQRDPAKASAKPKDPAESLQQRLQKAVEEERYEEAAKLRDELQKLQQGN